jgi:ketosteroid isomerase-like protein
MSMKRQQRERIERLFDSLVKAQFEQFQAGCTDDLAVTVRGSSPVPMVLRRSDIPDWYGSLQALSPTSLSSSIEVAQVDGEKATVILRHEFARNGIDYRLEMVNLVSFRDGLLAEWSSYPLDLPEYARAWRIHELSMAAPA